IDGMDPDDLKIAELYARVEDGGEGAVREVVLATNPTTTGEATALHIAEGLRGRAPEVTVTRLASGLPVGADLEYADGVTLAKARILDVRADRIRRVLREGAVALVAGFQGISSGSDDVTTLGRGGSDTTAVALAAAVEADVCEIYTDVPGVFSADPRIVPDARKLPLVSFEEMLEMAASGARVLQLRSVEYARNHGVRIHCRSSFEEGPGTYVLDEQETMERPLVTAVTHSLGDARITLTSLPDRPGIAGKILTALADANVNVDDIIQN